MPAYFFDSSAMVKRWVRERGTDWVRSVSASVSNSPIFISRLLLAEVAATLAAKQRSGELTEEARQIALVEMPFDVQFRLAVLDVTPEVIGMAMWVAEHRALRALDSIQVATACLANDDVKPEMGEPIVFVSADERQRTAAAASDLRVDDPEAHEP